MKIIIQESDTLVRIAKEISQRIVPDYPVDLPGAILCEVVNEAFHNLLLWSAERTAEMTSKRHVYPEHVIAIGSDPRLKWLKDIDWYEVLVDLAQESIIIIVR